MEAYATSNSSYAKGKAYFCEGCVMMNTRETFGRANFLAAGNGYPQTLAAHIPQHSDSRAMWKITNNSLNGNSMHWLLP